MSGTRTSLETHRMPEDSEGFSEVGGAAELLEAGKALQKVGTQYATAISVQKPRNLDKVVEALDREAEYAGASFYYGWSLKGGERVEGPSIGLANSLAREWTNCAVECDLRETAEAFYITAKFIDLEKGSQMTRLFRQRKSQVEGKYDAERKLDMALQIGQSKAIRNVVVNAVPRWLVERAMEKAQLAVERKIDPKKLGEYKADIIKKLEAYKVTVEQVVAKVKRPIAEWTTREISKLWGDLEALKSGEATAMDLFPLVDPNKEVDGPLSGKTVADALLKDADQAGAQAEKDKLAARQKELDAEKARQSGAPSPEEQARIAQREAFDAKEYKCEKCPPYTFATDSDEELAVHMQTKHPLPPKEQTPDKGKKGNASGLFDKR